MFIEERRFEDVDLSKRELVAVRITSDQALKWLNLNERNRRVRKTLVEYLARQIKSGEWQPSHPQPVVFSDAGRLIDGQHRLLAIASSAITNGDGVLIRVETGAPDHVREYLDTGISRNLEDRVELSQDMAINKLAAQLVTADYQFHRAKRGRKPSPDDAREFWDNNSSAIIWCSRIKRKDRGVGLAAVALAAVEYYNLDQEKAEEFYSDLFIPAGAVQQAQMLRDFLLRMTSVGAVISKKEAYHKSIGCMKAHMNGRMVKKVLRIAGW